MVPHLPPLDQRSRIVSAEFEKGSVISADFGKGSEASDDMLTIGLDNRRREEDSIEVEDDVPDVHDEFLVED